MKLKPKNMEFQIKLSLHDTLVLQEGIAPVYGE